MRFFVIALALVAVLETPAYAAVSPATSLTVKAGGFVFADSNTSTQSAFAMGLDYILHGPSVTTPAILSAYADAFDRTVGLGIALRSAGPVYAGAGVGLYNVSITPTAACPVIAQFSCSTPTYSANGAGGKIFAGVQFAKVLQIEGAYNILPSADGLSTNAVSVTAGIRL